MRFMSVLLALVLSIALSPFAYGKVHHDGHRSPHKYAKHAGKTKHVKSYPRTNGTYVHGYNRHPKRVRRER
jgi:hypothetical protein